LFFKSKTHKKIYNTQLESGQIVDFSKENTHRVPEKSGLYVFYINGRAVYVGHADANLRHRIESYQEKDDFGKDDGHPSKKELRDAMNSSQDVRVKIILMNKEQARLKEKKLKEIMKFNMDNKLNETN